MDPQLPVPPGPEQGTMTEMDDDGFAAAASASDTNNLLAPTPLLVDVTRAGSVPSAWPLVANVLLESTPGGG